MAILQNLDVEFVSLVDRAAVRNPANPDEPQRFLLWKSESGAPEPEYEETDMEKIEKTLDSIEKNSPDLYQMHKAAADTSLSWSQQSALHTASRDAQLAYLREANPAGAAVYEHSHSAAHGASVAEIEKSDDPTGALAAASAQVMKNAPAGSRYRALVELAKAAG